MPTLSFTEHPAAVGESYSQHLRVASSFSFSMICAGLACLVHGFFPFLFTTTASSTIRSLYERMVLHRSKTHHDIAARSIERKHQQAPQLG